VPAEAPASPAEHGTLRWIGRGAAIIAAAAFLGLLAYGLTTKSDNKTIDDALARSQATPAPNFTLDVLQRGSGGDSKLARAMADGRLSLRELRGSPVVLNFWASWCVPCREEAPALERFQRRHGDADFTVLGIDSRDLSGDGRAFVRRFGLSYPQLRDGDGDAARDFGTTGVPESILVDPTGKVRLLARGPVSEEYLSQEVAPLLPGGRS
jgi:cytochrome c biogenesis protein CcmG, thiol:disulfide interchange protein DsbE